MGPNGSFRTKDGLVQRQRHLLHDAEAILSALGGKWVRKSVTRCDAALIPNHKAGSTEVSIVQGQDLSYSAG